MLAGTGSGSGKTTMMCALLSAFRKRGISLSAFKCGPDYIDPMFHSRVLGIPSYNLDPYFTDRKKMRALLAAHGEGKELCLIEGVMGYYDGIGFTSRRSSFSVAKMTDTPVILIVDCRGTGCSAGAVLQGFRTYRRNSRIAGVIFNRMAPSLYPEAAAFACKKGIRPLGYLPCSKDSVLESRHLGLVLEREIPDFRKKMAILADAAEKTVDLDGILELARGAVPLREWKEAKRSVSVQAGMPEKEIRIAVAEDDAFCFTYADNIEILKSLGCRILYFSPLHDRCLPEGTDGLILSGGYPELHAKELSENKAMRKEIAGCIRRGIPCIAECGGFLYLGKRLESAEGKTFPMAGVLPCFFRKTDHLQRFGYMEMTASADCLIARKGESILAHEFHFWDTDHTGDGFVIRQAGKDKTFRECYVSPTLYAGFPHLYFYGNGSTARRFAEAALTCAEKRRSRKNGEESDDSGNHVKCGEKHNHSRNPAHIKAGRH